MESPKEMLERMKPYIMAMANLSSLDIVDELPKTDSPVEIVIFIFKDTDEINKECVKKQLT